MINLETEWIYRASIVYGEDYVSLPLEDDLVLSLHEDKVRVNDFLLEAGAHILLEFGKVVDGGVLGPTFDYIKQLIDSVYEELGELPNDNRIYACCNVDMSKDPPATMNELNRIIQEQEG